ncbi:hypothetical protein [Chitinophaga sancti]|uniref:Uncharacterized protein n=1 Tax=Chitinophaga sancti TaxID=1004 RepID=A0A1K1PG01_9BACT|nr:hypothetical protein [Chitinophaga sancti]WQD65868.1 hypothetical protein U0033_15805 [Chitinophaga sancti]WQG88510.1 hypothetical protein SR876_26665 [Chitinophaga sancti]SFW46508.1 hypothetical protein SAMN05661012_01932 [Chitinophaga sancti]
MKSQNRYPVRTGINSAGSIFKAYEKDIPVYDGDIQLLNLENVQASYTLKGDIYRRGDLFISMKDESMLSFCEKGDLVLLKHEELQELIVGKRYYFLCRDGKEVAGTLIDVGDLLIVKPENTVYAQVELKREDVVKLYKIMEQLTRGAALKELEQAQGKE